MSPDTQTVTACAGPSLALTKYWGKINTGINLPATPSLAVTLSPLQSQETVTLTDDSDHVTVQGVTQSTHRFETFFQAAKQLFDKPVGFHATCTNNFPTDAGLASSSSGFAALTVAINELAGANLTREELSRLARIGSGSAARAVFGGFVEWPVHADHATALYDETYWPELRVIVCIVTSDTKPMSSRDAMIKASNASPFYEAWTHNAASLHQEALDALHHKDLEKLGEITRLSYLRMFSTMLSMSPPLLYWKPTSLAIIQLVSELRAAGIPVWETMDAGPQVKLLCLQSHVKSICEALQTHHPDVTTLVTQVGTGPCLIPPTPH